MLLVVLYGFELRNRPRPTLAFELEFLMIDHSDIIFLFIEAVDLHFCELVLNLLFVVLSQVPVIFEHHRKHVHRFLLRCFFHIKLLLCYFLREI